MITLDELTVSKIEQTGPLAADEFVYVDISSVDNKTKRIVDPKRLLVTEAPSRARQLLRTGDVLVSMTRPNLNAIAMVPPELNGAIGSTGFHVLRAKHDVDPRWLFNAVQSRDFVQTMEDFVQGALYPAVRPKDIRSYELHVPPLDEQRRVLDEIEKQFSRLDEAVANLQRVKANLKRYKASVLNAAATGGFGEYRDESLLKWERTTLGSIADVIDPNPSHRMPKYFAEGYSLISTENFFGEEGIDFNKGKKVGADTFIRQRRLFAVEAGDFVLSRIGTIGKTRFLPLDRDYCLSHALVVIKVNTSRVDKRWLRHVISSRSVLSQARDGVQSVGVPDLGMGKIRGFEIAIPSIEEQLRISGEVDRRLSIIHEVEAEVDTNLRRSQALRLATLAKALSTRY